MLTGTWWCGCYTWGQGMQSGSCLVPTCHTHIFLQRPYALRCLFGREDGAVVGVLYATMHMDSYYGSQVLKKHV
jgi:hypothetical protein